MTPVRIPARHTASFRPRLAAAALLALAPLFLAAPAGALSVFVAGPAVVNNYPPDNVLSVRATVATTGEATLVWGLQGGGGLSTILGTMRIPAGQFVGFDSQAIPAGFPPGVYTLYATSAGVTRYGRTFGVTPEPPDPALYDLERDVDLLIGAAGIAPQARANLRAFVQGLLFAETDPARRARFAALLARIGE